MGKMLFDLFSKMGMSDWMIVIVVLSFVVDLTPGIKFNPITFIVKKLGDAFNHSIDRKIDSFGAQVNQRIDTIEQQLNELKKENIKQFEMMEDQKRDIDIAEVNRLKMEILDFGNRLSRQQVFSAEEYRTIMDCYTRYHQIIDRHSELTNGRIDVEYGTIVKHYEEHKNDGSFMF